MLGWGFLANWTRRFRFGLLNRFVLRSSTEPIDAGLQVVCRVPVEGDSNDDAWIESFVHRSPPNPAPMANNSGGKTLDDWRDVPRPLELVLKFPGTAGRAERSSPFPMEVSSKTNPSYEVWTWNPPGYGGSPGNATLENLADVGLAWADRVLAVRASSMTRVWLCGNSLGCLPALYVGSQLSASLPSTLLWLRNPPDLRRVILNESASWRAVFAMRHVTAVLPGNLDALKMASRCSIPAVFLMSAEDELCLPEYQRAIQTAYQGSKQVVELPGLMHASPLEDQHWPAIVEATEWLVRQSPSPA